MVLSNDGGREGEDEDSADELQGEDGPVEGMSGEDRSVVLGNHDCRLVRLVGWESVMKDCRGERFFFLGVYGKGPGWRRRAADGRLKRERGTREPTS